MKVKVSNVNQPNWKDVIVKSTIPVGLEKLQELSQNIWWVWNYEVTDLFREIDENLFVQCGLNPVLFLQSIDLDILEEIPKNKDFMDKLDKVYTKFRKYIDEKPDSSKPSIAYFSMEYGLTDILKIYSGGLGVLAGDYLKEASDCNVDLTAVGFLYSYGYFTQSLSMDGEQIAVYDRQIFATLPIQQVKDENGNQLIVEIPYPGRIVYANLWKVAVGRISLYLLDTENEKNSEYDRSITHQLYGGDWENRIKQEFLLGIGGVLTLKRLGIEKNVYHCNEGHAALINVQRIADYISEKGLTFDEAKEVVRASSLYTTHTPVPAGHDSFDEGLFSKYMSEYPAKLNISWGDFMDMGRENPGDVHEKFSMSVFACNTAQEVNGVSWLHGEVSKQMFQNIWKGYFPEESHVGYVTNGVHMPTWAVSEWKNLYKKSFDESFFQDQSNMKKWSPIYDVSDDKIWDIRMKLKSKLIDHIKHSFKDNWLKNQGDPSRIVSVLEKINPNALTIGFGRRFATYKRAHLLFTDLERLSKIVNNPNYPVQFIFTGKAHPADGGGQGLIKRIVEISRMPEFLGKVLFLENYDMRLAKRLISGVDIWLNTPTRPLEASGTSGEKALMNGILNFSVLDGWWYEGYVEGAGWALTDKRTYESQMHQDQLDAATIYGLFENEIIPLYYARNSKGFSPEWIQFIKNSIAKIAPNYTTKRMLDDYIERFYSKLEKRAGILKANNYAKAKELAAWKEKVAASWDDIKVESLHLEEKLFASPEVGETYPIDVVLDIVTLKSKDIGVELVVSAIDKTGKTSLIEVEELNLVKVEGSKLYFNLNYRLERAGAFKYAFRMFPKNEDLPHRQDFCYVRWI